MYLIFFAGTFLYVADQSTNHCIFKSHFNLCSFAHAVLLPVAFSQVFSLCREFLVGLIRKGGKNYMYIHVRQFLFVSGRELIGINAYCLVCTVHGW